MPRKEGDTAIQRAERLRRACQWMVKPGGLGWHNIDEYAQTYGVSTSTAWRDKREALKMMADAAEEMGAPSVEETLAELNQTIADCDNPRDRMAGLALRVKLLGLERPQEVEVTHKIGGSLVDAGDDEMEWVLAVLARSRDGLLTGPERDALALLKAGAMRQLAGPDEIEAEWAEVE
jgi:hypothetical protein